MIEEQTIRPFDPADTNVLRELFAQSIEYLTSVDYNDDQRLAWISAAEDPVVFEDRVWDAETFVVEVETEPAGFITLKNGAKIDMLYVHPYFVRQGVATMLIEKAEALASERGKTEISAEVSDTARPFFEAMGYVAKKRNLVPMEGLWLSNTTMVKTLDAAAVATTQATDSPVSSDSADDAGDADEADHTCGCGHAHHHDAQTEGGRSDDRTAPHKNEGSE